MLGYARTLCTVTGTSQGYGRIVGLQHLGGMPAAVFGRRVTLGAACTTKSSCDFCAGNCAFFMMAPVGTGMFFMTVPVGGSLGGLAPLLEEEAVEPRWPR